MTKTSTISFWHRALATFLVFAGLILVPTLVQADTSGVFPPDSRPYGQSYAQWSAAWWQWAYSPPVAHNPVLDPTGADCGVGQAGPVFFLAGAASSTPVTRRCTVPEHKALFFPLYTIETDNVNAPCGPSTTPRLTGRDLEAIVDFYVGQVDPTSLHARVDGVSIKNLSHFGPVSTIFRYTLPPRPNSFDFVGYCNTRPLKIDPAAAAGYYLMLAPLPAGPHILTFGGAVPGFRVDLTYHLSVER